MKKWIAITVLVIFLACLLPLVFIPAAINVSASTSIDAPSRALLRNEFEATDWQRWWPGEKPAQANASSAVLRFRGRPYIITDKKISGVNVQIGEGIDSIATVLNFFPVNAVSTQLSWGAVVRSTANPVSRVQAWFRARELKGDLDSLLSTLSDFYREDDKVYGLQIEPDDLKDTLLISNFRELDTYPGEKEIYALIDEMRLYAKTSGVNETGKPMLNIGRAPSGASYILRVAVPVDKRIPNSGNISYKRMPPNVRMLTADITGGQYTADRAMETMDEYAADHSLKLPAIPYFSLLTDRRAEPDTSKWVTRIYYPVMQ